MQAVCKQLRKLNGINGYYKLLPKLHAVSNYLMFSNVYFSVVVLLYLHLSFLYKEQCSPLKMIFGQHKISWCRDEFKIHTVVSIRLTCSIRRNTALVVLLYHHLMNRSFRKERLLMEQLLQMEVTSRTFQFIMIPQVVQIYSTLILLYSFQPLPFCLLACFVQSLNFPHFFCRLIKSCRLPSKNLTFKNYYRFILKNFVVCITEDSKERCLMNCGKITGAFNYP